MLATIADAEAVPAELEPGVGLGVRERGITASVPRAV
jgi:hypothetical protein